MLMPAAVPRASDLEALAACADADALRALAACEDLPQLMELAAARRDAASGSLIGYSRKLFVPLTHLCRDVCHYCTFAKTPRHLDAPYMSEEEVLEQARLGAEAGCKEALFTLGEKPELRYREAREALEKLGFATTVDYVAHLAARVLETTGLLPHINAGNLSEDELARLRPVSASMGLMLENVSERLCQTGMPHYGSPDKEPARRLATLEAAGAAAVPFTSGLLIGIGETRLERLETLLALRRTHERHGHLQEVIVQNFRAKPDTKMARSPEPSLEELLWSVAMARLLLPSEVAVQAPPNLSPGAAAPLIDAGIGDWGGVSPLTPDYVNPEAPWPHLRQLAAETAAAGKTLVERLTIYPRWLADAERWLAPSMHPATLRLADAGGLAREDRWVAGAGDDAPSLADSRRGVRVDPELRAAVAALSAGEEPREDRLAAMFLARGDDFAYLCRAADERRAELAGEEISFVVNRNINYTNICERHCSFCAFAKGRGHGDLRGRPYRLDLPEIERRVAEAWARGATEVCLQGGIHPDYSGQTYLDICAAARRAAPDIHIHAFSPLEVSHGARTLGLDLAEFLQALREAGLNTLPGTAAEILDDEVRRAICADKLDTHSWLEVMRAAHGLGLRTTATIMFGHVDAPVHWARHLLHLRRLQLDTGGFTEFVPLPFVPMEAPMYRRGRSRSGPVFREAVLMHAVSRLALAPGFVNIQASWVKMGLDGAAACLESGANDFGGTLMNESITRAAGAVNGQEVAPMRMEAAIENLGRRARQRTTLYAAACAERMREGRRAAPLAPIASAV